MFFFTSRIDVNVKALKIPRGPFKCFPLKNETIFAFIFVLFGVLPLSLHVFAGGGGGISALHEIIFGLPKLLIHFFYVLFVTFLR